MLRTTTLATIAALAATPALAGMGKEDCNWTKNQTSASASTVYSTPLAATATTIDGQMVYSDPVTTYSAPAATTTYIEPAAATTTYVTPIESAPMSYTEFSAPADQGIIYAASSPDIVDTAASAGNFNTLVAAVQAAGLVDTLKGPGPFTVFAPSDAAFAALPAGTVDNLLKPENIDQLRAILTYHVVPGKVTSDKLAGQQLWKGTVQGDTVQIDGTAGVRVDNANVVSADIQTSNGVIHVIDTVLMPNT